MIEESILRVTLHRLRYDTSVAGLRIGVDKVPLLGHSLAIPWFLPV